MGEPDDISMSIIKYTGVFDLRGLLRMVYQMLIDSHFEVHERAYKHKVPNPYGEEDELSWFGEREINWYCKAVIILEWHTFGVRDIDVVRDGKKIKMQEGMIQVHITSEVKRDYSGRFKGSKFQEGLKNFYDRFIAKQYLDNIWEDQLYYHQHKIQRAIKEFLGMSTPTNASEGRW